jgi:hypothetical protein
MAVIPTQTYLITLNKSVAEETITKLIAIGVSFEILNPHELGEEWSSVKMHTPANQIDLKELEKF